MADNRFLMNFLQMRTKLGTGEETGGGMKSSIAKMPEPEVITMATIIEEKPPKAKVLEYFKKRIEEMEED